MRENRLGLADGNREFLCRWIAERCEIGDEYRYCARVGELWLSFVTFCDGRVGSAGRGRFSVTLQQMGFTRDASSGRAWIRGIALRDA